MKVVQAAQNCELEQSGRVVNMFKKDEFYIMSDVALSKFSHLLPGFAIMEIPFAEVYTKYDGSDLNGKKIIMLRHGGGGDILFMATGAAELKRKYPKAVIHFAIGEQYRGLIEQSDIVDGVEPIPISLNKWNEYHFHLTFEGIIEDNFRAKELNAYDLFLTQMGFDPQEVPPENKLPKIFLSDEEREEAQQKIMSLYSLHKKIGIQIESSSPIRNYPQHSFLKVGKLLIDKGYDVYYFGGDGQDRMITSIVRTLGTNAYNASCSNIRDSVLLASFMDCFIAPDSMFIHVAGALGIPVIGIYGPFLGDLRMRYFMNAISIDAQTACSPCFMHGHFPCPKGDPSPCFSLITPEVILEVFEKLIEEKLWQN